ncbi:hypothetical protein AsAng_0044530 [Aureispira anguillae]|uniref:Uncharacterized protein n=1 Tax=Aureispira anguillae TaxID=2864201 RepID=A0A915YIA9_9BACT|nr:hypothetical protein AsAng_0044530 [Aureispira anguillae]
MHSSNNLFSHPSIKNNFNTKNQTIRAVSFVLIKTKTNAFIHEQVYNECDLAIAGV